MPIFEISKHRLVSFLFSSRISTQWITLSKSFYWAHHSCHLGISNIISCDTNTFMTLPSQPIFQQVNTTSAGATNHCLIISGVNELLDGTSYVWVIGGVRAAIIQMTCQKCCTDMHISHRRRHFNSSSRGSSLAYHRAAQHRRQS